MKYRYCLLFLCLPCLALSQSPEDNYYEDYFFWYHPIDLEVIGPVKSVVAKQFESITYDLNEGQDNDDTTLTTLELTRKVSFDEDGRFSAFSLSDPGGVFDTSTVVYEGGLVRMVDVNDGGGQFIFEYDDQQHLVLRKLVSTTRQVFETCEYSYNDSGKVATTHFDTSYEKRDRTFSYDEQGNLIRLTRQSSWPIDTMLLVGEDTLLFTYDSLNRLEYRKRVTDRSTNLERFVYRKDNRVEVFSWTLPNNTVFKKDTVCGLFVYRKDNRVELFPWSSPDTTVFMKDTVLTAVYENGLLVREGDYRLNRETPTWGRTVYRYEFDSHGNWTKKERVVYFCWQDKSGSWLKREEKDVHIWVERQITYYE